MTLVAASWVVKALVGWGENLNLMFDAFASNERPPVKIQAAQTLCANENLSECRHRHQRGRSDHRFFDGHIAPTQRDHALFGDYSLNLALGDACVLVGLRDEGDTGGVFTLTGKVEGHNVAVKTVWCLDQNSRPVTVFMSAP